LDAFVLHFTQACREFTETTQVKLGNKPVPLAEGGDEGTDAKLVRKEPHPKIKRASPQKSVRKNRQYSSSQIPGVQNAVGRARACMEAVGALPGVPSDSVNV
jgi:hypothetical protein